MQDGTVVGTHKGIIHYTIGQRKRLGISSASPLYVLGKNIGENKIILGSKEQLAQRRVTAVDINLISVDEIKNPIRAKAKIRYNMTEQSGILYQTGKDTIVFEFDEPQRAVTAGQALVVYDGDSVIGGGMIV